VERSQRIPSALRYASPCAGHSHYAPRRVRLTGNGVDGTLAVRPSFRPNSIRASFGPCESARCLPVSLAGTETTIEPTAAITHRWAPIRRIGSWLKKTLFNQSSAALFIQIQGLPGSVPARTQEYEKQAADRRTLQLGAFNQLRKIGLAAGWEVAANRCLRSRSPERTGRPDRQHAGRPRRRRQSASRRAPANPRSRVPC
jgi:hypothetical protein